MNKPKLILLYGFASSGKTTLSKKYIDAHPLAMAFEGDPIISMIGQWRKQWREARSLVFEYSVEIIRKHLSAGHDVVLPYLLIDEKHAGAFEKLAEEVSADLYEVYINLEKEEAFERLLKRGVWGEEGSPKLTEEDRPEIQELWDAMELAMNKREKVTSISSESGDIDGTYNKFLSITT